jgi:hypothetical protein
VRSRVRRNAAATNAACSSPVAGREVRARALEGADQPLVRVERQHVVAVEEGEVLAPGGIGARVARAAQPAVRLPHDAEARVGVREPLGDRRAVIGRPVVDEHGLEVTEGLAGERPQALVEVVLDVVDRDYDAELRHAVTGR